MPEVRVRSAHGFTVVRGILQEILGTFGVQEVAMAGQATERYSEANGW